MVEEKEEFFRQKSIGIEGNAKKIFRKNTVITRNYYKYLQFIFF